MTAKSLALVLLLLAAYACGGYDPSPSDAAPDAGQLDAGRDARCDCEPPLVCVAPGVCQ